MHIQLNPRRRLFDSRRPSRLREWAIALIVMLLATMLVALVGGYLYDATDVPEVHVSARTGRCVRVEVPKPSRFEYSCQSLPARYQRVWVN